MSLGKAWSHYQIHRANIYIQAPPSPLQANKKYVKSLNAILPKYDSLLDLAHFLGLGLELLYFVGCAGSGIVEGALSTAGARTVSATLLGLTVTHNLCFYVMSSDIRESTPV